MNMESPTKSRTALSSRNVNLRRNSIQKLGIVKSRSNSLSPLKNSNVKVSSALKESPIRRLTNDFGIKQGSLSPVVPKRSQNEPFVLFEESQDQRTAVLLNHMSLNRSISIYYDENDYELVKENMSPRKLQSHKKAMNSMNSRKTETHRKALRDLSISEFKGYVEDPKTVESTELTIHINDGINIPNYVTPPRDSKLKNYFNTSKITQVNFNDRSTSRSTDDIPKDKIIRKLNFTICND